MPEPLSDAQLAAYQAVVDAASPEPWRAIEAADADVTQIWSDGDRGRLLARVAVSGDGAFIVAARNAVPVLLAEVQRLRAALERLDGEARFWGFEYRTAMDNYLGESQQVQRFRTELTAHTPDRCPACIHPRDGLGAPCCCQPTCTINITPEA